MQIQNNDDENELDDIIKPTNQQKDEVDQDLNKRKDMNIDEEIYFQGPDFDNYQERNEQ